jgi:putative transposase
MPRQARKISPTDYYHVMLRGNNREKIFMDEDNKSYFMELLINVKKEFYIEIAAYCIMDNHIHIVISGNINDLSKAIKIINIKYAVKFNKETNRIGHVFQDRYKSEVISNNIYLLQVIRYVHNNPVKAKIVDSPEEYPWSSCREFFGYCKPKAVNQKQIDFIMEFFFNKIDLLKSFHQQEDNCEYLECKEEIEQKRMEAAYHIINNYYLTENITEKKEILKNPNFEELIKKLLSDTKLSHRKIADILCVNNNAVHKVSLGK